MLKIPIDFDMSGFVYDPDNPTAQTEKLNYALFQVLDALRANGAEFRQLVDADITDSEAAISDLLTDFTTPPETSPTLETPNNSEMLLDAGIYTSLNMARMRLLPSTIGKVEGTGEDISLEGILEVLKLMLGQDFILQLSDGSKILWRSRLIDDP